MQTVQIHYATEVVQEQFPLQVREELPATLIHGAILWEQVHPKLIFVRELTQLPLAMPMVAQAQIQLP